MKNTESSTTSAEEAAALCDGAGWADLSGRTLVELTGADRHAFLHNLCTADIKKLQPGEGCEAFLTNAQGRTIGFVFVFSSGESLVIETAPSQGEAIVSHLDRYLFRENVEIFDRTEAWGEILVAGAASESLLGQFGAPLAGLRRLGTTEANFAGCVVSVSRVQTAGPVGFLLRTTRDDVAAIGDRLRSAGAVQCSAAAIEAARIESGIPTFGVDVTAANLPQEVSRDATAIHFNKGCYIGQETVARIDALGHVNRHLCGVAFAAGDVPPPGTELSGDGRPVGKVTSSAYSPRLDAPLALAYLRRGHHTPGVRLASSYGTAEVVHLPVWRKEA